LKLPNCPTLEVDLESIRSNYQLLRNKAEHKNSASVVKANAYGLGVKQVSQTLAQAGCKDFFVANLEEAIEFRQFDSASNLYVFNGIRKGQRSDFIAHKIIPVINDLAQLEYWQQAGNYALHIDTGMTRLGITPKQAYELPAKSPHLKLIISHLACADTPSHRKNAEQLELFKQISKHFQGVSASLANSSGVFIGQNYHFDLLRPGCSLYGISPNSELANPMQNCVKLSAPILQYRKIDAESDVGYGATSKVKKGSILATVEIGYADGFMRNLSNNFYGYANNIKLPIIGRVSMDMLSVDVSEIPQELLRDDLRIEFINQNQPVDIMANAAKTIGYEIFTRIGNRVQRIYA